MMAALHAGRETVSTLLSLGADVDAVNGFGHPALHYAIRSGDTGTVEMLCDKTHSGKAGRAGGAFVFILPCSSRKVMQILIFYLM